jgi:hypothetical protein
LGWFSLPAYFGYYFFLFVYIFIIAWLSRKAAPELANFIISQAGVFTGTLKRVGGKMKETYYEEWKRGVKRTIVRSEKMRKWAERQALATERWGIVPAFARRAVGRALRIEETEKRNIGKGRTEAEKIKDATEGVSRLRDAIKLGELGTAIGMLTKFIEKGGEFKKAVKKEITPERAIRLAKYANTITAEKEAKRIGRTFIDVAPQMGFKISDEDRKKYALTEAEREAGLTIIQKKLIAEARKADEIKDFKKDIFDKRKYMMTIQKFWEGAQIREAAKEFKDKFIEPFNKATTRLIETLTRELGREAGIREYIRRYPKQAIYLAGNAAQGLGLKAPLGLTRKEIRRIMREEAEREVTRESSPGAPTVYE